MPLRSARLLLALVAALAAVPGPLPAETVAPPATAEAAARLGEVLMIPELIAVLREEGIDYAMSLEGDLFPSDGGTGWRRTVEAVHDLDTMRGRFQSALADALAGDDAAVAAGLAFFGDSRGQRILTLELEARRALIDEKVEEAARVRFAEMEEARDPRLALLRRFAEVNDLVEMNVQGALNANLAFFRGLAAAGGPGTEDLSEDQMLSDVWAQEAEVRTEIEAWVFPFLALAYAGLTDAEIEAYIAFSETAEGRRLNAALFAAFDALFLAQSFDLGRATGLQLAGQDI